MTVDSHAAEGRAGRFGIGRVHRDAGSTAVASLINAVLGAAFWAFAAVSIPPVELGVMTAVLAVIVSTSSVVAAGVGDAYTALLPAVGPARLAVYRRGQRVFAALVVVAGAVAALVTIAFLDEVRGSVTVAVLVAVGVVAVSLFTLQISTLIALGRAAWVPATNSALGLAKILLLPAFAFTIAWHSVELAVVVSSLVIALIVRWSAAAIIREGRDLSIDASIPAGEAPREFNRVVLRTCSLSALGLGVVTLTPFLVTVFAGPREGALFALTFSVVATLDYIASAMAVSLAVHASSAPEHAAAMARGILLRAGAVTVVGTAGLLAVFSPLLRVLNPEYDDMNVLGVVAVLCAATLVRVAYIVWAALQQSRRKLGLPIVLNGLSAVVMFAAMPSLCSNYGAVGGAMAVLIHQVFLTAAAVFHVAVTRERRSVDGT